jgi:hypothetical protein
MRCIHCNAEPCSRRHPIGGRWWRWVERCRGRFETCPGDGGWSEFGQGGFKTAPTLSEIIRGFKTFSARCINHLHHTTGVPVWQRNYYEHVVRGENELNRIREYIANNPLQWDMDRENPLRIADGSRQKAESWEV